MFFTLFLYHWGVGDLDTRVSGQAAQPILPASLKLGTAVYGQKLDGRPSG